MTQNDARPAPAAQHPTPTTANSASKLRPTAKSFVFRATAAEWTPQKYAAPVAAPAPVPAPVAAAATTTPAKKSSLKPSAKEFKPSFFSAKAAPFVPQSFAPVPAPAPAPAAPVPAPVPPTVKDTPLPETSPSCEKSEATSEQSVAEPEAEAEHGPESPVMPAPVPEKTQTTAEKAWEQSSTDKTASPTKTTSPAPAPVAQPEETTPEVDVATQLAVEKEAELDPSKEATEEPETEADVVVAKTIMYTIAQLLEMEPEECPMPEGILGMPIVFSAKDRASAAVEGSNNGKEGRIRRGGESGRNLSRGGSNASDGSRGGRRERSRRGRGSGPVDTAPPLEECAPLQINEETRWKPSHAKSRLDPATDGNDVAIKEAKSILNKLSIEKFDKLSNQLIEVAVRNIEVLSGVIDMVIEKAQMEWHFSTMYAELCSKISQTDMPAIATDENEVVHDTHKLFRKLLLTRCQKQFEVTPSKDGLEELPEDERLEKELILKRATLGHIRFIGELYKQGMLSSRIMHVCIQRLFGDVEKPDEESLECLCKLLSTIGHKLEVKAKDPNEMGLIKQYYTIIKKLSADSKLLCTRVRFMLQDLLDLRKNKWVARRKETKAMTIAEVHAEAAREAKEKAKSGGAPGSNARLARSQSLNAPSASSLSSAFGGERRRSGSSGGGAASAAWKARAAGSTGSSSSADNDGWETAGTRPKLMKSRSTADRSSFSGRDAPPRPPSTGNLRGNSFAVLRQDSTGNGRKERGRSSSTSSNSSSRNQRRSSSPDVRSEVKAEAPAPTVKEPMTADAFEKRAKSIFEEYMVVNDMDDAAQYFVEMAQDEHHGLIAAMCLNLGLEKGNKERSAAAQFLVGLVERKILTADALNAALQEILEFAEDMEIDIPLTLTYLSDMIAPSVVAGSIALDNLASHSQHMTQNGKAGKLMGLTLARATKLSTPEAVRDLVTQAKTDLKSLLAESQRTDDGLAQFYSQYELSFML